MSDTKTYCPHGCHRGRVIDLAGGLTPEGEPATKPCPECEGTGFVDSDTVQKSSGAEDDVGGFETAMPGVG